MDEYALPTEVRRLIEDALASMEHVEVLFRVSREREAGADRLARDAHIEPAHLTKILRDLERANLITGDGDAYRLTRNPRDRAIIHAFAAAYDTHPVIVIRAVYARSSPLRSFADAFRLRREE